MHYYLFYESNIDSLAGDLGITLNWTETVICMSVFFVCFFQSLNYNCLLKLNLLIFCLFFPNVFAFFPIIRKSTRNFYIWLSITFNFYKVPNKFSFLPETIQAFYCSQKVISYTKIKTYIIVKSIYSSRGSSLTFYLLRSPG